MVKSLQFSKITNLSNYSLRSNLSFNFKGFMFDNALQAPPPPKKNIQSILIKKLIHNFKLYNIYKKRLSFSMYFIKKYITEIV
jgi:hypothetical protein